MINYEKYYNDMLKQLDNVEQEYLCFKNNKSVANRNRLLDSMKKFDICENNFKSAIKNMFLK